MTKRIMVSGSRLWTDVSELEKTLAQFVSKDDTVIHGDCYKGADRMAKNWCVRNKIKQELFPAEWNVNGIYRPNAGLDRNKEMLDSKPNMLIAFLYVTKAKGYKTGTMNAVNYAKRLNIPVHLIEVKE